MFTKNLTAERGLLGNIKVGEKTFVRSAFMTSLEWWNKSQSPTLISFNPLGRGIYMLGRHILGYSYL